VALTETPNWIDSVGFGWETPPNAEAAGAVSTILTDTGGAEDANIEVAWLVPEPASKMKALLFPVGGTPRYEDEEVGL
jgi:hypothetical protein